MYQESHARQAASCAISSAIPPTVSVVPLRAPPPARRRRRGAREPATATDSKPRKRGGAPGDRSRGQAPARSRGAQVSHPGHRRGRGACARRPAGHEERRRGRKTVALDLHAGAGGPADAHHGDLRARQVVEVERKVVTVMTRAHESLVQRVREASVTVDGGVVGAIGAGLLVLAGITRTTPRGSRRGSCARSSHMRIFDDDAGVMNRIVLDTRRRDAGRLAVHALRVHAQGQPAVVHRARRRPDIAQPRVRCVRADARAADRASPCRPACSARTCRSRSSTTGLSPCGWIRGCGNSESPRHRRRNPGSRRHHGRWTAGAIFRVDTITSRGRGRTPARARALRRRRRE